MQERIIIAGAGDFGLEIYDWLLLCKANVAGFIDDVKSPGDLLPAPLLGTISEFEPRPEHRLLLAIGDPTIRKRLAQTLYARGAQFTTMGCEVTTAPSASWGEGTICCPHSLLAARAKVGAHCHINVSASIGHHVKLGDYCTVSSHVDICGNVEVEERVFFGSHAVVLPKVKIGAGAVIGAGAIVTRDVPRETTVYAEAARRL